MSKLTALSISRLKTCHPLLQKIVETVAAKHDIAVLCGHRGEVDQRNAVRDGKSKLQWPNSRHNSYPSRAVDIAPLPLNWEDHESFCRLAGVVKKVASDLGITLRWGGDWDRDGVAREKGENDLVHFELV